MFLVDNLCFVLIRFRRGDRGGCLFLFLSLLFFAFPFLLARPSPLAELRDRQRVSRIREREQRESRKWRNGGRKKKVGGGGYGSKLMK